MNKELPLRKLLDCLTSADFQSRIYAMPSGREDVVLLKDPLVKELMDSMKHDEYLSSVVEEHLDALFSDFREGEDFAHTEAVMALFLALRAVDGELFRELAGLVLKSTCAELGRLRHFCMVALPSL